MSSYLLTWNPKNWGQEKFDAFFDDFEQGKVLRWSCGTTKKIIVGDNFYLFNNRYWDTGDIKNIVITIKNARVVCNTFAID